MIIYPAMDLIHGEVVRLQQGRFDQVSRYATTPLDALRQFAAAGAQWVHIVDLDGARTGQPMQHALIAELVESAPLNLQVAGGFRQKEHLARMFETGVARVVVGSLAVREPDKVRDWVEEFGPERIVISLDVRLASGTPTVAITGWTEESGRSLWDITALYPNAQHFLVTDIGRDGMLEGPNFELYEEVAERLPNVSVQASGGVSSLADLERLSAEGAIIGKALWEGRIDLQEALDFARA